MSKESRRAIRTQGSAMVYEAANPDEGYRIEDLSVVGLSVRDNPPWGKDDVVVLKMVCAEHEVNAQAKVVRRTPEIVAMEIVGRTPEQDKDLFELMLAMVRGGGSLNEQRRAPRLEVDAPATWSEDDLIQSVKLANLSLTGAVLEGSRVPDMGTEGVIRLQVPGDTPQCEARVSRQVTDGSFAVEFLAPTEAFRMVVSHIRVSHNKAE